MPDTRTLAKLPLYLLGGMIVIAIGGRLIFPPRTGGGEDLIPEDERQAADLGGVLPTLDDRKIDLSSPPGRVMLINFWATWCGPCVAEMPSIESLHKTLAPEGLYVIAITSDPPSSTRRFVEERRLTFDVSSDPASRLARRFKVRAIPDTLLIDAHGRIAMRVVGRRRWDDPRMVETLRELLREE